MNRPTDEKQGERLRAAVRRLMNGVHTASDFPTFVSWLRTERNKRDVANRNIGHENKTSEAHALSVILDLCAECQGGTDEIML